MVQGDAGSGGAGRRASPLPGGVARDGRAPLRVAFVSLDLVSEHDPGDARRHVREMLTAFVEQGARVELFTADPASRSLPAELRAVTAHPLTMPLADDGATRERAVIAANVALDFQLRARGPFDVIFERFSPWCHGGMDYAAETGTPGFLELGAAHLACKLPSQDHRMLAEAIGTRVFGRAAGVVVSAREVARCVEMRWGCAPRLRRDERPPPPERVRRFVEGDTFVVGFAGELEPGRGLLDLGDAFSLLRESRPGARLLVVGHGSEEALLEAECARRGWAEDLLVTGWVKPDVRPALMEMMDVAVTPFPTAGSVALAPFAVYEAMIAGLPVVGSSVAPLRHALRHGRTGLTFEPRSPTGLATALEVLHHRPRLRREMGRRARKRVLEDSTPEAIAREVLAAAEAGSEASASSGVLAQAP